MLVLTTMEQGFQNLLDGDLSAVLGMLWALISPVLLIVVAIAERKLRKSGWQIKFKDQQIDELSLSIIEEKSSNALLANILLKGFLYSKGIPPQIKQEMAEGAKRMEELGGVVLDPSVKTLVDKVLNAPAPTDVEEANETVDTETQQKLSESNVDDLLGT